MASVSGTTGAKRPAVLSPARLGRVGQVATSWGLAGGLAGSVVVTIHVLLGQLSSSLGFLTTTLFFVGGSAIGYLHGGILAYLGRPEGTGRWEALKSLGVAALYAGPVMIMGWLVGMALAMSAASALSGRVVALLTSLIGWVLALLALAWAVVETGKALRNLYRRWPGARALFVTLGLVFLAVLPVFLVTRPEIWVLGVRPTATAAVAMALGATLWIAGPLGALALLAVRARAVERSTRGSEVPSGSE